MPKATIEQYPVLRYPFGRPVSHRPPSADGPRPVMLLGAYPSALHVRWTPPKPLKRVWALAVDDEPTPFWEGDGEDEICTEWSRTVGFRPEWGQVCPASEYNGPSGQKLRKMLFNPLGIERADTWITDCLDQYYVSDDNAKRIKDTYHPFVEEISKGEHRLQKANIFPHPAEGKIVRLAVKHHLSRLLEEVRRCAPERIVTLGNAALRVVRHLARSQDNLPRRLRPDTSYGELHRATVAGLAVEVLPLAHPAAPAVYQQAHSDWLGSL